MKYTKIEITGRKREAKSIICIRSAEDIASKENMNNMPSKSNKFPSKIRE